MELTLTYRENCLEPNSLASLSFLQPWWFNDGSTRSQHACSLACLPPEEVADIHHIQSLPRLGIQNFGSPMQGLRRSNFDSATQLGILKYKLSRSVPAALGTSLLFRDFGYPTGSSSSNHKKCQHLPKTNDWQSEFQRRLSKTKGKVHLLALPCPLLLTFSITHNHCVVTVLTSPLESLISTLPVLSYDNLTLLSQHSSSVLSYILRTLFLLRPYLWHLPPNTEGKLSAEHEHPQLPSPKRPASRKRSLQPDHGLLSGVRKLAHPNKTPQPPHLMETPQVTPEVITTTTTGQSGVTSVHSTTNPQFENPVASEPSTPLSPTTTIKTTGKHNSAVTSPRALRRVVDDCNFQSGLMRQGLKNF